MAGSLKACVNEFTKLRLRAHSTFESVCPRAVTLSGAQPGGSEEADRQGGSEVLVPGRAEGVQSLCEEDVRTVDGSQRSGLQSA